MSELKKLLAAATADAIDGRVEVERWKFTWGRRSWRYRGASSVEWVWTRPTSGTALIAKERDFHIKAETADDVDGTTIWHCKYETDRDGSYCRYVFRTRCPREFYALAVAAKSERKTIDLEVAPARPGRSMRL